MPEGHSVHRIARQFARLFVGRVIAASSPQGRFAEGASLLDGRTMTAATAVGKQMFLRFDEDTWLRVHLGLYGAWDFAGDFRPDATTASANGRMGQTNQRGTVVDDAAAVLGDGREAVHDGAGEDSLSSMGAPRKARWRMAESEKVTDDALESFPPEPIGQVRVRLLSDNVVADLRGPTACVVQSEEEIQAVIARLGPDPLHDDGPEAEERFVTTVRKKRSPIGLLLMDQSVVAGIGNVYRAELLFRARLDPHAPGTSLTEKQARDLWRDWATLLRTGVETGQMMTMDDLSAEDYRKALASRDDRHWVYHRTGLPCRVCGTHIAMEDMGGRALYWCPKDQKPKRASRAKRPAASRATS